MGNVLQGVIAYLSIIICYLFIITNSAAAGDLVCGIAMGFPPYQFEDHGQATGFDADVIRLVARKAGMNLKIKPDKWDDLINYLRFGRVDCIAGMEITDLRNRLFDFTAPYYNRSDVVFARADNDTIQTINDLYGKKITGDRHSFVENYWNEKGIKDKIRIMQTDTKKQAIQLLHDKDTFAAIMPKMVGLYLAKEMNFKLKIIESPDPGSPVAIAVSKGNTSLLKILDQALQELIQDGEIEKLYQQWFQNQ